ncbi:hypothetical protein ABGB08_31070 [Acrocarpospora sp. B8E8]
MRDVVFRGDHCRARTASPPSILSTMRSHAIGAFRLLNFTADQVVFHLRPWTPDASEIGAEISARFPGEFSGIAHVDRGRAVRIAFKAQIHVVMSFVDDLSDGPRAVQERAHSHMASHTRHESFMPGN